MTQSPFGSRGFQPIRAEIAVSLPPNPLRGAHNARCKALMRSLPDHRRIALVENLSRLGSAWTTMVLIYKYRELSDRQTSVAMANCLLLSSETADHCRSCNQQAGFQHGDICESRRHRPNTIRHDSSRDLLARWIRVGSSTVVLECAADAAGANPLLRGDARITGPAAPDGVEASSTSATRRRRRGTTSRQWGEFAEGVTNRPQAGRSANCGESQKFALRRRSRSTPARSRANSRRS
jgi:hypothetical protein